MKTIILICLLLFTGKPMRSDSFYYRDSLGKIRIRDNYPRDTVGDLAGNKDSLYTILSNDSELTILEKCDLMDSITPSVYNPIRQSQTLNKISNEQRKEKKEKRIFIKAILSLILLGSAFTYFLYNNHKK